MAPTSSLYAWAVPAFSAGSPVDHTWVTTYDNRVKPTPTTSKWPLQGNAIGTAGARSTRREEPRTIAQAF